MQVEITCRHGSIDSGTHDYISRKSEKLLTFFERVTAIGVTIDFEGITAHEADHEPVAQE